jgi:alkylhydroperoxidase family enzyme
MKKMLRWLIEKKILAAEKRLGAPADYMRHILRVSLPAFFKFVKILPLAEYRRKCPIDAFHVARLVATRDEDCGTCVQIEVNLARHDGVPADVLQAVLASRPEDLAAELADVYHFAEEVVTASGAEGPYRERIRECYGEEALVELAMTMAACRVFPITKRALGYAKSCSQVHVRV